MGFRVCEGGWGSLHIRNKIAALRQTLAFTLTVNLVPFGLRVAYY